MIKEMYYREDHDSYARARVLFVITLLFGWLGVYRFYKKKIVIGIVYIFTYGLFGIGWISDVVLSYKEMKLKKELLEYYQSVDFWDIKNKIKKYVDKCNELNDHIEELKLSFIDTGGKQLGNVEYIDNSNFNFKRQGWDKLNDIDNHTYQCSATVCKNAQSQPFKYLCKYFNMKPNEDTLNKVEEMFNNFSAVEEGKNLLAKEQDDILKKYYFDIPDFVRNNDIERFVRRLGFKDIDFSDVYYPRYKFLYVSPGGNSTIESNITLDLDNLSDFIEYLSEVVKFKKSVAGQRALMTPKLREHIKERDNYTCQHCGLSIRDEPNLLLEIDHIIPLSKGGMTTENNLQTLCWKCNRKKGSKIKLS